MNQIRFLGLLTVALLVVVACGGTAPTAPPATEPTGTTTPATPAPATPDVTAEPATDVPATDAPATAEPGDDLDPSLSDAGIVGWVTISNDSRGHRDGLHQIIAVAADGSSCSTNTGGELTVVAWFDDAPDGQIHQMAVTFDPFIITDADKPPTSTTAGSVYIDFVSASGFGTAYSGTSARENSGISTITAARSGDALVVDFSGQTWDNVDFVGKVICADFSG